MSLSQSAGANFVPLLARLVLAAAFLPAGYNKVMTVADFSGDDAKRLRELQVVAVDTRSAIRKASLAQATEAAPASTPPAASPQSKPTTDETPKPAATGTPPAPGGEPLKARQLYRVTLMVDKMGWQYPVALGWIAALTELVGGLLLLVGLLSRVWALGLATAMGVALYLTSIGPYIATAGFFRDFPDTDYSRFAAQAALFALAFGVVLTGAGSLSLDRMLTRGGGPAPGGASGKKTPSE